MLTFPSMGAYHAYLADERRQALLELLQGSGVQADVRFYDAI